MGPDSCSVFAKVSFRLSPVTLRLVGICKKTLTFLELKYIYLLTDVTMFKAALRMRQHLHLFTEIPVTTVQNLINKMLSLGLYCTLHEAWNASARRTTSMYVRFIGQTMFDRVYETTIRITYVSGQFRCRLAHYKQDTHSRTNQPRPVYY